MKRKISSMIFFGLIGLLLTGCGSNTTKPTNSSATGIKHTRNQLSSKAPKNKNAKPPHKVNTKSFKTGSKGILSVKEGSPLPVSSQFYIIKNEWLGNANGVPVQVFAGYKTKQSKQGAIVYRNVSNNKISYYKTKRLHGALHIIKKKGNVLILKSSDGSHFTFDVVKRDLVKQ